ncbi:uncharacterized protein FPOAC1_013547 [Fusarium poae]|uniref:RTA1 like protein n=1 Tax=Fusarium poae TaxID=36050 RepID=A0A1B8AAX7_FUSPO|nr:uncharacterized protein FPOAC1_013547 [Fusarium poae]KAG8664767.1 hypothetical protein FPOAC1_013547 [Fusarium poae]OBS15525.1 hypothetical protein FPOA_13650 [Fusarium poae]OBS16814.1 hypothetical protein FPOA_12587 [Fusarium poae]OBS17636.1 hypothetical protein FPOA_11929 [Fusarium poae]
MVNYFHYEPSFPLATIFVIVFTLSSNLHIYQIIEKRTWFFIPFVIGSLFEAVAFFSRAISAKEAPSYTFGVCVVQNLLILLGPTCYSAAIYMLLGRYIKYLDGDSYSLIKPFWLTKIFLFGDITSIVLQVLDGGKIDMVDKDHKLSVTEDAVVAGLIVQLVFFTMFVVITTWFYYKFLKHCKTQPPGWQKFMMVIYASSMLILIRSIFRMAEYIEGPEGELQSKELYIYVLDAIPMAMVTIGFHVFHPSRFMPRLEKTLSTTDSKRSLTF